MKHYSYFDSHVHIRPDGKQYDFIDISTLDESLKERNLTGCLATIHSNSRFYKKDFFAVKEYCKNYSNIIPSVEITQPFRFNNVSIDCHIMYMGEISGEDINYGSWFCHVEKAGGLFFQYEKKRLSVKNALAKNQVSIVETTGDIFSACNLKSLGLTVLLGTDIHPGNMKYTSYLGSKGTIIEHDEFNYETFMDSLKSNALGYFSKKGNNYLHCLPNDFRKKAMKRF
jgi:hypothetical protein